MRDGGADDAFEAAWKSLSRQDRAALASEAARGLRGRNRKDAAFMLWWATRELRRGPRPGLAVAGAVVAALLVVQLAGGASPADVLGQIGSSAIPIILLIPLATWLFRRPKLQRSVQLNGGVLSGKALDGPPDADKVQRLLTRAQTKGWLGDSGADTDA